MPEKPPTAEHARLLENDAPDSPWYLWGPYLPERQWGTVREDYSPDGAAWDYFPHEHARSRAYRWGEDGLLGISDRRGILCFALAMWNGNDPFLKERLFGLTNSQGNHGEDVKEAWAYLDATPTHSYLRATYRYPHAAFPYDALVDSNRTARKEEREIEIEDLGVFNEDRFFDVEVEYAKAESDEIGIRIRVTNRGPDRARMVMMPTLWFRNRWSWAAGTEKPLIVQERDDLLRVHHPIYGELALCSEGKANWVFTENETNFRRLYGSDVGGPYTKDAFHSWLIDGDLEAVNPNRRGTKAAAVYDRMLSPGEEWVLRFHLGYDSVAISAKVSDELFKLRADESAQFYEAVSPGLEPAIALIQRQAFAGLIWCKQYYHFDVSRWINGDDGEPRPPPGRKLGRNSAWRHFHSADIMSMPDSWEYPWFAAWDLAFHCISFAAIDAKFAKDQLILLLREWFMHPNGQIPAYEWSFDGVNPPVHAWAAWRIYQIERRATGRADIDFLERCFHKLLLNFTWWVNRKDAQGNNVFEGGFLGLDNIGIFDRNTPLGDGTWIEQSDGTSWMAMFCLNMLTISLELARHDNVYEDVATKFLEHFLYIARAVNNIGPEDFPLWNEEDGFYYDVICQPGEKPRYVQVRSVVGLIPLFAAITFEANTFDELPEFKTRMQWFLDNRPDLAGYVASMEESGMAGRRLLSLANPDQIRRVLERVFDEREFLSPFGIRSLSKAYTEPYNMTVDGHKFSIDYEPAESTSALFGGNSNWRGPVWFPLNFLFIETLQKLDHYFGDDFKIEVPTGTGTRMSLADAAAGLERRLLSIFVPDMDGRRPFLGQSPGLGEHVTLFHEYFDGDTGRGLGASHQTGWTSLIAKIIQQMYVTFPVRGE